MKDTRILTAREIRHLTRVHAQIGALLAWNRATPRPPRPKGVASTLSRPEPRTAG